MIIKEDIVYNKFDISNYNYKLLNEDIVFFDIETTGFSRVKSYIYLIGYMYYKSNNWHLKQLLIENLSEEHNLLQTFSKDIINKKYLIHFNGDNFDIPFITSKYNQYNLQNHLPYGSIDLYKIIKPFKRFLSIDNCKLKTIEKSIEFNRQDTFNGGQLIEQFFFFIKNKDSKLKYNLLLHNQEDITSLLEIFKLSNFLNSIDNFDKLEKISIKTKFMPTKTICVEIDLPFKDTYSVNYKTKDLSFSFNENQLEIEIPYTHSTLYYFFENYKDYYYIKDMDEAIHKSVGQFYTSHKKVKASASNCYIKKEAEYINSYTTNLNIKNFAENNKSKEKFYLLDELISNENLLNIYIKRLVSLISGLN